MIITDGKVEPKNAHFNNLYPISAPPSRNGHYTIFSNTHGAIVGFYNVNTKWWAIISGPDSGRGGTSAILRVNDYNYWRSA